MGKSKFCFVLFLCALGSFAHADTPMLQIPCKDRGIPNYGKLDDFCGSTLPDCNKMVNVSTPATVDANGKPVPGVTSMVDAVKDVLSWKIYGWYLNLDLDLSGGLPPHSAANPLVINPNSLPSGISGKPFNHPICSVVGHGKLAVNNGGNLPWFYDGSSSTAEISYQSLGLKASCGTQPQLKKTNASSLSKERWDVNYDSTHGTLWSAYMMGAMPWLIRKNAYDVLTPLINNPGPTLANLSSLITSTTVSPAVSTALNAQASAGIVASIKKSIETQNLVAAGLTTAEKLNCYKSEPQNCTSLTVGDTAQKTCSIQKARTLVGLGAVGNLLAFEILNRSVNDYKALFGHFLDGEGSTVFNFLDTCGRVMDSDENYNRKGACFASCVMGLTPLTTAPTLTASNVASYASASVEGIGTGSYSSNDAPHKGSTSEVTVGKFKGVYNSNAEAKRNWWCVSNSDLKKGGTAEQGNSCGSSPRKNSCWVNARVKFFPPRTDTTLTASSTPIPYASPASVNVQNTDNRQQWEDMEVFTFGEIVDPSGTRFSNSSSGQTDLYGQRRVNHNDGSWDRFFAIDGGALTDAQNTHSVNVGFAGLVEQQIRQYCNQKDIHADNPCDKIGIPSIPLYVTESP